MLRPLNLKFLADENFSFEIISLLKKKGFDIDWIGDTAPGVSDRQVYHIAQESERIILTEDKDFGELAIRYQLKTSGVVLLRINSKEKELRKQRILDLFEKFPGKLAGYLVVIDAEKIRFRRLYFD